MRAAALALALWVAFSALASPLVGRALAKARNDGPDSFVIERHWPAVPTYIVPQPGGGWIIDTPGEAPIYVEPDRYKDEDGEGDHREDRDR